MACRYVTEITEYRDECFAAGGGGSGGGGKHGPPFHVRDLGLHHSDQFSRFVGFHVPFFLYLSFPHYESVFGCCCSKACFPVAIVAIIDVFSGTKLLNIDA